MNKSNHTILTNNINLLCDFRKERNDYSKLLLDMLCQGTLQEPFTSSPPTGMLKCVFPYMVRLKLAN